MTDVLKVSSTRYPERSKVTRHKRVLGELKAQHEGMKGVLFQKQEVFVALMKLDVSVVGKVAAERKSEKRGGKAPVFPAVVGFFGFH